MTAVDATIGSAGGVAVCLAICDRYPPHSSVERFVGSTTVIGTTMSKGSRRMRWSGVQRPGLSRPDPSSVREKWEEHLLYTKTLLTWDRFTSESLPPNQLSRCSQQCWRVEWGEIGGVASWWAGEVGGMMGASWAEEGG